MSDNYRSMEQLVPREEYERVKRELSSSQNNVRLLEKRLDRRELASRVFRNILAALVACAVVAGLWYGLFRGCAFGAAARQNAEREARVYATRKYGETPLSVWCEDPYGPVDDLTCYARLPNHAEPVKFYCDDDAPSHNDGCRTVVQAAQ